jgi:hypothetical protein
MSHLHIDATQILAAKLVDIPAGMLVMAPSETTSASGPFWGLRFNINAEDAELRGILWLNGMPWHGPEPMFYGMPLDGTNWESMRGLACGRARIEIDMTSGLGRDAREMRWEKAAGHIAVSARGTFLLGEKSKRESMWGAHYAIDIGAWAEVEDAWRDAPVEWFSRWSVVVEARGSALAMPFDARAVVVAKAA